MAGQATIRAIDATSNKPEVCSTLNVATIPMKQVAGVQTGVPNVYLEQQQIQTVIENDLRLSVYDGLDELVRACDSRAAETRHPRSGQHPRQHPEVHHDATGIGLLAEPDPADAGRIGDDRHDGLGDLGRHGRLRVRAGAVRAGDAVRHPEPRSKVLAAPVVMDTRAHGALYLSPLSLARFEENAGRTNTSLVRLEGHAQYGTERRQRRSGSPSS